MGRLNHQLFPGTQAHHRFQMAGLASGRELPNAIEVEQAIETIETISAKTEDKQMYDQREKAQRDFEWALSGAREEGLAEGIEKGREEGKLAGTIQTLQELLGDEITSDSDLMHLSIAALTAQQSALQARLRRRDA